MYFSQLQQGPEASMARALITYSWGSLHFTTDSLAIAVPCAASFFSPEELQSKQEKRWFKKDELESAEQTPALQLGL